MKLTSLELGGCKVFIADHLPLQVLNAVEFSVNAQATACFGAGNHADDDLLTIKGRPRQLIVMNEEQLAFDLVPLARALREVMHFNVQSPLLLHATQFELTQLHSMPIAAPAVGGGQVALKVAVVLACEMMTGNWEAGYFAYDCKRLRLCENAKTQGNFKKFPTPAVFFGHEFRRQPPCLAKSTS